MMNSGTAVYLDAPIEQMQFKGLHWIEASAGTGKTYTLSSLMVRIFLKDYLPNQVIATTFTRAAAAELKTRIRLRLIETRQYFQSCQALSQTEIDQCIATQTDPLLKKVLSDYRQQVDYAEARLQLVIEQLDELFVGTLDSFSQKLLREFSFESGKIERAEITDRSDDYVEQLVHDSLRAWIQAQAESTIQHLLFTGYLKPADYYMNVVKSSLNFSSVQLQTVPTVQLDTQRIEQALTQLAQLSRANLSELSAYYAGEFTANFSQHVAGKEGAKLQQLFLNTLPELIDRLADQPLAQFFNPNLQARFHEIDLLFLDSKGAWRSKIFNAANKKCSEADQAAFLQHPVIQCLHELVDAKLDFQQQLEQFDSMLKYHLSAEVKQRLPQLLQQKGETTFTQQIRTLADALQGEQGQRFAQFVHARYPLILVDEFQDTNQDQDSMLASIWRNAKWYMRGCMIMVGDPKQAIYAFRGGDMLTYNQARQDVLQKKGQLYSLAHNHRSVKALVTAVDELFQRDPNFGEQVEYHAVQAGTRPHPDLIEAGQTNPHPLRWLALQADEQEEIKIAWHIQHLLNLGQQGQLYLSKGDQQQAIQANDIAVLSSSHRRLDAVQYELERLGVRVNRSHKRSVFAGFLAKDVAAILTAILHPFDEAKVKRALLTRLLGYNLKQLITLEQQGLGQFIYDFDCIRDMWVNKGFLSAWNYTLNLFQVWENLVAKQSFDNERQLVNLRHLSDILSKQSERRQGAYMLYQWFLKHVDAPGEREWEIERKLSNAAGIQLMSIHQSKGLEFKVVFLMGADQAPKNASKGALAFSTQTQSIGPQHSVEKRVISIRDRQTPEHVLTQHEARVKAEQNRLWYVALTRASHRVYAAIQADEIDVEPTAQKKTKAKVVGDDALNFWRLKPSRPELLALVEQYSCFESGLKDKPANMLRNQTQYMALYAQAFPQRAVYPRSKTSFSALAQHLAHKVLNDSLVSDDRVDDAAADEASVPVPVTLLPQSQPIAWINANFPKGTMAGSFLHQLFEHISFQDDRTQLIEQIKLRFKNDKEFQSEQMLADLVAKHPATDPEQAKAEIYAQLADWLIAVLATPLHAEFQLNQLSSAQHLAEFPFYLALADQRLFVERIKSLFAQVNKPIHDLNPANSARYLNGSIDLVYFDGQRYHIADYKSNYLGADQQHYTAAALEANMTHSSYWLQAALYLVALHRYLNSNLQDYAIAQHLGGASYLYLRGMQGQQGSCYWKPEDDFILALDQLLGYHEYKNETSSEKLF